jgi:hypothetical protein
MAVMTLSWKIVIDCADPHAQAAFWSAALGYTVEDNSVLIGRLLAAGHIDQSMVTTVSGRAAFRGLQAVRHPDDPVQEVTGTGRPSGLRCPGSCSRRGRSGSRGADGPAR